MRSMVWACAAAFVACSTQGGSSGGSGGGSGGGPATHLLIVHTTGAGQVRSTNPAFMCRGDCTQPLQAGNQVTLTAVADAGARFDGWQGACRSTGDCVVTLDSDRNVTASFSQLPPPPTGSGTIAVAPTGTGAGRVTSTPSGIDCPRAACSLTVPTGTSVTLTATADEGSTFAGFGGACSGTACVLTANGTSTVWANFEKNPPPPPPPPPAPDECAGLTPGTPPAPVATTRSTPGTCAAGLGDGTGAIGLEVHGAQKDVLLYVVDGATGATRNSTGANYSGMTGGFTQQPAGFLGLMRAVADPTLFSAHLWNENGIYLQASQTMQGKVAFTGVPAGGLLLAGDFHWYGTAPRHQIWKLARSPYLEWGGDLASSGTVFGLGADADGRVIVITNGGYGRISAQWFDRYGSPLTGEFIVLESFQPGANTWFDTAPLIGGGVALRRVDEQDDANGHPYRTGEWLRILRPGAAASEDVPAWLANRPNLNVVLVRNGAAYAFLPMGAPDSPCTQKIEVVAASGNSCGTFDVSLGTGSCRTEDVAVGADGTPIQLMPAGMSGAGTCSWRWWPHALN